MQTHGKSVGFIESLALSQYDEKASSVDKTAFYKVVASRRAVRQFSKDRIPGPVFSRVIKAAILAPSSSNMQLWHFIRVKDSAVKKQLAHFCLDQPAATTAAEIIAVIARPSLWKKHRDQLLSLVQKDGNTARVKYYKHIIPMAYSHGPCSIAGLGKWLFVSVAGIFRPVPRGPFSNKGVQIVAIKSAALAAENIMLALRAEGFDSCPMEAFDELRAKRLLRLKASDRVVMLIAAGERAKHGVLSPRVRFPLNETISEF
ncbi:MAG: nitroreductase family protein [Nanoarchaeota archaeon]